MTVPSSHDAESPADAHSMVTAPIRLPVTGAQPEQSIQEVPVSNPDAKVKATADRRIPLIMIAVGVLLLLAAVLSYRHGIATNLFPPYLADGGPTPIPRYSAPWIVGAAGLTILAGLLLTHAAARLVHYKL